jgi:hypothetical protein
MYLNILEINILFSNLTDTLWLRLLTNFVDLSAPWEPASCAGTQKLPSISWNPKFITVFITAPYYLLSWARWIQPVPTILTL